jgi:hypothetical protein
MQLWIRRSQTYGNGAVIHFDTVTSTWMQDTNLMSGRMMVVVPVAVVIIGSAVMSSGSPLSLSEQDKKRRYYKTLISQNM